MRQIVVKPWFALAGLLLILASGVVWIAIPKFGIWFTLLALLPWAMRLLTGNPLFQRTPFDLLMAIFLISAWVGYWAAYDKTTAWIKVWLIVTSVLLYYALSGQPKRNLEVLSLLSFSIALAVSAFFFLTADFAGSPGSISAWWMSNRPHVIWPAIHHGYICGLLVITTLFALYWFWSSRQRPSSRFTVALRVFFVVGLGIILWVFVLTMSRGVWMAMICGLGAWVIWRITRSNRYLSRPEAKSLFPLFVLGYLCVIVVLAYLGPARVEGGPSPSYYGSNSRAEIFERSAYFVLDYPIIGSGLNSFPGLYSEYMLGIPIFYFINSYNMFLDVAIEQGLIGGLVFIFIYLGSIWLASWAIVKAKSRQIQLFSWLGLFSLIFTFIHGFFYDYLYNGIGTLLLFFPVGYSMLAVIESGYSSQKPISSSATFLLLRKSYVPWVILVSVLGMIAVFALNMNKIISVWYSNLGAVQMSQVYLRNFPTNKWTTPEIVPQLEASELSLRSALQYNPNNQTANYRLGLISMLRQDFNSASENLEIAHKQASGHRGIIKSLGYSYAWLGNLDKAKDMIGQIPETQYELGVYQWWWNVHGQPGLAKNAYLLASYLDSQVYPAEIDGEKLK